MKKIISIAAATLAGQLIAGTYTWTGAAKDGGLWFTAGNWNYDGAAASTSPGHELNENDVVIDGSGVVVTYVPGGDFITQAGTTLTVSGGATLCQNGGNWPFFHGNVIIDGGTMDYKNNETNPDQVRLDGTLFLRNGGQLLCKQLTRSAASARVVIGTGVTYEVDGTVGPEASEMYQQMEGGTLYIGDELRAANGVTYTGSGTINCRIFAPQTGGSIVTFNGPNLIMRTKSDNGFWQSTATYIDVPAGSTSKFTIMSGFKTVDDIYPKTFGSSATTPKFRYNGAVIDKDMFTTLFTVEDHGEAIDGDSNYADFYLTPTSVVYPSFVSGTPAVTLMSDTEATVAATVDAAGSPVGELLLCWGTADGGHDTNAWANVRSLGTATDSQTISDSIALVRGNKYYVALAAATEDIVVWASFARNDVFALTEPGAPYNVWKATVSDDSRVDGNWSLGHVPTVDEIVFVYDNFVDRGENHMVWYPETAAQVGGWEQPANFANNDFYVNFRTTTNSALVVTGNVSIAGGTWTHEYQHVLDGAAVNVEVRGNLTLGQGAYIHTGLANNGSRPGGISTGYTRGEGPGYLRTAGGSYAGEGGHITNTTGFVSYGSILSPLFYGSGGWGDKSFYAGGGIVKLAVGGALTVNGTVAARGFGYPIWGAEVVGGAGSGGSINITAASLAGSGTIDANGGSNGGYGPGSGGRVKVALTGTGADFTSFTGTIQANGGGMQNDTDAAAYDISPAAAGTVCLVTAAADPVVKVDNVFRYANGTPTWRKPAGESIYPATHLPAMQDYDALPTLKKTRWELSNHGAIRLTRDVQIAALSLAAGDATQKVFLDGHTLTVTALMVGGRRIGGTHTAAELNTLLGADVFVDAAATGSVICGQQGFTVIVR